MKVWIYLLIVTLSSCTAQWHLEQAIKKDPNIVYHDTMWIDTTIYTEGSIKMDTLVLREIDTLTLYDSATKIETQIIRFKDTFYLTTKVLPDTIRIIKQMQSKPRKTLYLPVPWYKNMFFWILTIILVVIWLTRRNTK